MAVMSRGQQHVTASLRGVSGAALQGLEPRRDPSGSSAYPGHRGPGLAGQSQRGWMPCRGNSPNPGPERGRFAGSHLAGAAAWGGRARKPRRCSAQPGYDTQGRGSAVIILCDTTPLSWYGDRAQLLTGGQCCLFSRHAKTPTDVEGDTIREPGLGATNPQSLIPFTPANG